MNDQLRHHPQHQAAHYPQNPAHVPTPDPSVAADAVPYFPPVKTEADQRPVATGYMNRVLHVDFPDLTLDSVGDPVWVELRNPQLVHPGLLATDTPLGADGMPVSTAAGLDATYEVISKLALDWRAYDATTDPREPPVLLGAPSAQTAARLPLAIVNRLGELIQEAASPR